MNLSPHFTLREFCRSATAARLGIENWPTDRNEAEPWLIIERMRCLANEVCEPIRAEFGPFSPNSGYRCLDLNRALRSGDRSKHRLGAAVDLEHPRIDNLKLAQWIDANCDGANYVLLEFYEAGFPSSGWIHVEGWPDRDVPTEHARPVRRARTKDGRVFHSEFV